jgi:DNA-binding transcriptional MerR regulator
LQTGHGRAQVAAGGRRRYSTLDLEWIVVCTRLRRTGMPIRSIRRYAELVAAGHGNEQERLALLEAHRADVVAKLAELQHNLELIDHKLDVYRGRIAAGDADRLWAPAPLPAGAS